LAVIMPLRLPTPKMMATRMRMSDSACMWQGKSLLAVARLVWPEKQPDTSSEATPLLRRKELTGNSHSKRRSLTVRPDSAEVNGAVAYAKPA
jgi:hypothetical protein